MNWPTLLAYVALGAALAWACVAVLQRTRRRTLHCIAPYVPAHERQAPAADLPPPPPLLPLPPLPLP